MAGQQLERQVKERIGASYLKGLIEAKPRTIPVADFQGTLRDYTSLTLPSELVEKFGLPNLIFQIHQVDFDTLPLFFSARGNLEPNRIFDSIFTLEVARRVDLDKFPAEFERKVPMFVRMAGVDRQKRRVVALKYNASDDMKLVHVNVSLGDDELHRPEEGEQTLPHVTIEDRPKSHMNTSLTDPYRDAGFITEGMMRRAGTPVISVHRRLLKIPAEAFSSDSPRAYDARGFFLRQESGQYVIGISKQGQFEDISVPQKLKPEA